MGKPSLPRLLLAACGFGLMALLQGCATHTTAKSPCNHGVCKVVVTVQSCANGKMSVNHDPIPVPAPNNIEWTIEGEEYAFPQDGIVIEGKGFTNRPGSTGNGKKFIVHDDHTDKRPDIKYTIRLTKGPGGSACAPYDPFISNH